MKKKKMTNVGKREKKLMDQRVCGGISTFIAFVICAFFLTVIFVVLFDSYKELALRNKVDRTWERYLETMEINGYLTEENRILLINELQGHGMTNISLNGTDFAPVGYGNTVTLAIEGDLSVRTVDASSGTFAGEEDFVHVSEVRTGTALY